MTPDLMQGGDDVLPLHLFEASGRRRDRGITAHLRGEVVGLDLLAGGENHRALDGVLQLPHIAGPIVALKAQERGRGERLVAVRGILLEEVTGKQTDVLAALAERRKT